jgi:SAM-dependent methyltransferase
MVSMPDRATRAYSFGEIADDYDRYRPGPPPDAARWVLGGNRLGVLDLGAGTGGLTRALVQVARWVAAVEPDARMRGVLARRSEGAAVVGAVGEELPFADGSFDAVVASSSWHWMEPDTAGADVARVLRVGGAFGLLWTGPDRRLDWVCDLLGRRRFQGIQDDGHRRRRTMVLPANLPFSEPETKVVEFGITADADDLAGLSGTYSVAIVGGGPGRHARIEAARARARAHPALRGGSVELPMVCRCWRAFRTEDRSPVAR